MSKVISAHAVSVDGYVSGRTPCGVEEFGRGLGDAGLLFDWYFDGDTASQVFDGFTLFVDEVVLHQVPVLLGGGHSFFQEVPKHVRLRLLEVIPAPGVTHLHYEVIR